MHPNPAFRNESDQRNLDFAKERGFGVLTVSAPDGPPLVSHVPFLLADDGIHADLHLVRSNPIARVCKAPLHARFAISGPDSYVSPDWYGVDDQVPTWNYVAVHLIGQLHPLPQEDLRDLLDRQSAFFEERLLPKLPWTADKTDPEVLKRFERMIQPFRFDISAIEGTWKLNQNKPDAVREAAADAVAAYGIGQELPILAALMRGVDKSAGGF